MIDPKNYNHKLYEIAVEGKFGKWELKKIVAEPDKCLLPIYNTDGGFISPEEELGGDWKGVELLDSLGRVMTDLTLEQDSYKPAVEKSHGRVLMCGLGLGLFNVLVEGKIEDGIITQLDVVELDEELIDWVTGYIPMLNTKVIPTDAWDYLRTTPEKYDLIFIDIWSPVAQAVAEGPEIAKIAERCLLPNGEVRYWMQELGKRLSNGRYDHDTNEDPHCLMCERGGGITAFSNLYGGLCRDCAEEYEMALFKENLDACILNSLLKLDEEYHDGYEVEDENVSNRRLRAKLEYYGYEAEFSPEVKNGLKPDILVKSKGIAIEAKKYLHSSQLGDLMKVIGLHIGETDLKVVVVIYSYYDALSLRRLWTYISKLEFPSRVKVVCWDGEKDELRYVILNESELEKIEERLAESVK